MGSPGAGSRAAGTSQNPESTPSPRALCPPGPQNAAPSGSYQCGSGDTDPACPKAGTQGCHDRTRVREGGREAGEGRGQGERAPPPRTRCPPLSSSGVTQKTRRWPVSTPGSQDTQTQSTARRPCTPARKFRMGRTDRPGAGACGGAGRTPGCGNAGRGSAMQHRLAVS